MTPKSVGVCQGLGLVLATSLGAAYLLGLAQGVRGLPPARLYSHVCSHGEPSAGVRGDTRRAAKPSDQGRRTAVNSHVRPAYPLECSSSSRAAVLPAAPAGRWHRFAPLHELIGGTRNDSDEPPDDKRQLHSGGYAGRTFCRCLGSRGREFKSRQPDEYASRHLT